MTDLKDRIRALTPEQLEMQGILRRSPDGKFVCPNPECNNGEGDDGTGIDFTPTNDGTFVAKCFKCGEGFDIIHVLAWHYNLSIGKELFSRVATDFNLHLGYTSFRFCLQ